MRKIFFICMIGIFGGTLLAHCQSLTSRQVQDLQGELADDQRILNDDIYQANWYNSNYNNREAEINSLTQRIQDAEAFLNAQANSVNGT
jgi:phage host-nuclease inhibitor protein Gam